MDSNSILFMVMTVLAIATLCLCTAILVCNYRRRNELSSEQKIWQNSLVGGGIALVVFTYPIFYWITDIKDAIDLLLRVIPIIMAAIAFVIAYLNFQRKSGASFTSHYQIAHNKATGMPAITKVWLKNNKDKSELLFDIYIEKDGKKLVLQKFSNRPMSISSYETKFIELLNLQDLDLGVTYEINQIINNEVNQTYQDSKVSLNDSLNLIKTIIEESDGIYMRTSSGVIFAKKNPDIVVSKKGYDVIIDIHKPE